jgi:hypothetical protein
MDVLNGNVDIVEQVGVKFHRIARAHEYHNLLLQILAQECEQKLELARRVHNAVTLFKRSVGALTRILCYLHKNRIFERQTAKILHLFRHGSTEERCHTRFLRQQLDDFVHFFLKTNLENSISLINNQHLQVMEHETFRVFQVVE